MSDRYRRQFISKLIPVVGGKEIGFVRLVDENPSVLKLVTEAGEIEATFARSDTLLLRMEALAEVADRLGRGAEAAEWRKKADALAERAIATLFDKDGSPRVRQVFTGEFSKPQTMLTRLGLMFGKRLPEKTRAKIVSEMMSDDFLTPYGLATESVKSPNYKPDGYWLGPIWGPEMMISHDALRRAGYEKEARDVALRFCRLCAKSGFAENFDAFTGAPRRDPAYTWTAAAFLVMAHELG